MATVSAGHQDLNVTMGYKAVYPKKSSTPTGRS